MEKMLERAVLFAYRRATMLGADELEALETALGVLFDARPHLDEAAARGEVATMLAGADGALPESSPAPVRRRA